VVAGTGLSDPSLRHLMGRLAVIEARVVDAVARRRRTDPDPDDGFRGLYLTDEHVDRLLGDRPALSLAGGPAESLLTDVEADLDPNGSPVRLHALRDEFDLDAIDVDTLLAALAPDLDPRFEKLFGYLHDDVTRRRASVGLAIELAGATPLDAAARSRFGTDAPLVRHGLLVVDDLDRPFLTRSLRVPDRVTAHLLGEQRPDPVLAAGLRTPPPVATPEGDRIARALAAGVRLVHCRQPPGAWTAAIARCALGADGCLVVDVPESPTDPGDQGPLVAAAVREARLSGRVLVLGPVDNLDASTLIRATRSAGRLVLHGSGPWDPSWSAEGVLGLDLHELARRPAAQMWQAAVGDTADSAAVAAFRLAPDQIDRAVAAARSRAAADGIPVDDSLLAAGARMQNATGLGRLARRIEPSVDWDDLVVPPPVLDSLQHLADRVRWRDLVLGDWGLRRAGGRGEGISGLFAGEPGTGKTMAAEVIAGALGLDLYVIDLSAVIDKYIGETEKNLERIFAGAEGVNGVLFFDEADAIFGKRSEVSDAHDRYANVEIAYLLQRMERFDGVAILATNLLANVDDAFARRLSVVVNFARPDVAERRHLWQKSLAGVPLAGDVDFDLCATSFDLTGGEIRNVAVTAAYFAASEDGAVDMRRVVRAVQLEFRKIGRLYAPGEFDAFLPTVSEAAL
jgi:hypothetical protein